MVAMTNSFLTSKPGIMVKAKKAVIHSEEVITSKIFLIRGLRVMLDFDLAEMYAIETKQLKRQVRRNRQRFPKDFMFELTQKEYKNLRSQSGTSGWGGSRYMPMAFTQPGVSMLSGILNSKTAIDINIRIMRVFNRVSELLLTHKDILIKLQQLEKKIARQDGKMKKYEEDLQAIFVALKSLLHPPEPPRNKIGFRRNSERQ